jgi:hypothetical protein
MFPEPGQLGLLIYAAAIIGWLAKYFYDMGYYGVAYRPRGTVQIILGYSALGFLLISVAVVFYSQAVANNKIKIPEIIGSIPISPETAKPLLIYAYIHSILIMFVLILIVAALVYGHLEKIGRAHAVNIETYDESEQLDVRGIYHDDKDFFYFFDNEGNWGAIKKNNVRKIRSFKKDSIMDEWIKKKLKSKRNR